MLVVKATLLSLLVGVCAAAQSCGGFTPRPNTCPSGYVCIDDPDGPECGMACDFPGICTETCGGFVGGQCPDGKVCIDDPRDDCDPNNGGYDCSGYCIEPVFCGGIAGVQCPLGKKCIDNPNDVCDPENGGADCGGICV